MAGCGLGFPTYRHYRVNRDGDEGGEIFCPSRAEERNKGSGRGDDERRITGRQIIKGQTERSWDKCVRRLCMCVCVKVCLLFMCSVCFSLHTEWEADIKSVIKAIKRWSAPKKHHTHVRRWWTMGWIGASYFWMWASPVRDDTQPITCVSRIKAPFGWDLQVENHIFPPKFL